MDKKWIWLDMDGTIAALYEVNGWLDDLIAHKTRPYEEAKIMYNYLDLLNILYELKMNDYQIGIISWGSKERNLDYDNAVRIAKEKWLCEHFLDLVIDKVIVTSYGIKKADTCRKYGYGILIDDEEQNRNDWDLGSTINANQNIIKALSALLNKGI